MKAIFILFLFLLSPASGKPGMSISEVGNAPAKGVYDPESWLAPIRRAELEANFASAFEKWGVKVFVVILPETPEPDVAAFSKDLGQSWGGTGTWGVLTHVIGDPESPWCFGERGENLRWAQREEFERVLADARNRAHRESDPPLSVMVGARELTDELGFLGIVSKRRYQLLGEARQENSERESGGDGGRGSLDRMVVIGLPVLLVLSLVAIFLIVRKPKSPVKGFEFPESEPRRRFGGPWSGGGDVLVKFRENDPR